VANLPVVTETQTNNWYLQNAIGTMKAIHGKPKPTINGVK